MDPTVLSRLEKFQLGPKETDGLQLEFENVQVTMDECHRSFIGKLIGDKMANYTYLKNRLTTLWSSIQPFKTRELGVNPYQFIFAIDQDKQMVLHGKA